MTFGSYAQSVQEPTLNIGDPAPPLYVNEWMKGEPIVQMEKGHVYVVEFWATWCRPCIAAMPHLSELARQYKDTVSFIGVSIYESEQTTPEQIRSFVDNMGEKMDYHAATDDNYRMVEEWIKGFGEEDSGIPRTFIINADGKVGWIGHPSAIDTVLRKIVDNEWDITEELERRNELRRLEARQREARECFWKFSMDEPEAVLQAADDIVEKEPMLKNTRTLVFYTFRSLVKIDQKRAYEYAKKVLTSTDGNASYTAIIDVVDMYDSEEEFRFDMEPEIYSLGAEAYQKRIDQLIYPEVVYLSEYYAPMANWYWKANEKEKAIESQEKAIEALKSKESYSEADLERLESELRQYQGS